MKANAEYSSVAGMCAATERTRLQEKVPMKKGLLLTLLTLALAISGQAQQSVQTQQNDRHQSYISYDEGGTVIRSGEDGKEIDVQRNVPLYPGDEVITGRRGRTEVHLSDGNIIGVDRATTLRFKSILDSYDGDANETVAELRYGKVAVQRTDVGRDHIRLDTDNASYVASYEAIYSVETDTRGRDRVVVFDGTVEVRTPNRTSRLREGESASVDDRGPFDLIGDQRYAADDFERWFLKRAEHFTNYTSRYMDRRLSYWNDDLDDYGSWVFVTGIGYSWHPRVGAGWRPYYNGYWSRRHNCLTWVSYDPWGWGTYHYGRWAFDPGYGWVWVPGYGYSPAWVYWMHGSNYIGWAPAGYWDCNRGYYDWAYRPYRHAGVSIGLGFYGRVRVGDLDLRPWTFIDRNTIVSTRVDRAALTTDVIKQRLGRTDGGYATISGGPARISGDKLRDPADEIRRRGLGGDAGIEAGTPADLTGFFRRDPQIASNVRDRIVRSRGPVTSPGSTTPSRTVGGGSIAPITGGGVAPITRGGIAPVDGGGSVAPINPGNTRGSDGRVNRGDNSGNAGGTWRGGGSTGGNGDTRTRVIGGGEGRDRDTSGDTTGGSDSRSPSTWRDRRGGSDPGRDSGSTVDRSGADRPSTVAPAEPSSPEGSRPGSDSWRNRAREDKDPAAAPPPSGSTDTSTRGSDVPRRVIDRIGGARVYPRDGDSGSNDTGTRDRGTNDRPSRDTGSRDSGSHDRGSRDSGSGNSGGERPSRVHNDDGGSSRSASPPPAPPPRQESGNRDSGSRESGGRIKRDQ
jgi:hypothetical protein